MTAGRPRFASAARRLRAAVFGLLLVGCGLVLLLGPRPDEDLPQDPDVTVVTYWEKWSGPQAAQMQQIVDEFNATVGREKKIFVRFVSVSGVTQKTLTATAAGVPPDIAGTWDAYLTSYAALDALEPLDELAAARGIRAEDYKPVYWRGCLYRDRLYGLPSVGWVTALIYNKRLLAESADRLRARGLDPYGYPCSIEKLDRYAAALETRDDRGRLDRAGYLPLYPGFHVAHAPFWFGGRLYDPASDQLTLTDPACVEAFRWVRSYSERLGTDSLMEFRSGLGGHSSAQNPFLAGKVVMMMERPFIAGQIDALKPSMRDDWAAAPFPSAVPGLKGVCFAGFDALVIPRGAKHKAEAFEFIAFVNRPDVAERLARGHCTNSFHAKPSDGFERDHPNRHIKVFEELAAGPNAQGLPPIAIWPEVGLEMGVVAESVYLLEKTPEQALADAQRRLSERYREFKEIQAKRNAR